MRILLIAEQRDVRRQLFDVLTAHGWQSIQSARDLFHAAVLLEGQPGINLIILALPGDAREAAGYGEQLSRIESWHARASIAIIDDDRPWSADHLPGFITDCLFVSRIDRELIVRCQRAVACQASRQSPESYPAPLPEMDLPDEAGENEWLIADLADGRIVEVGVSLLQRSGLAMESIVGQPLSDVIAFDDGITLVDLKQDEHTWRRCERKSAYGIDYGEATQRPVKFAGRPAVACIFRQLRVGTAADTALSVLGRFFSQRLSGRDMAARTRWLGQQLHLDFVLVDSQAGHTADRPQGNLDWWRDAVASGDPMLSSAWQRAWSGEVFRESIEPPSRDTPEDLRDHTRVRDIIGTPLLDMQGYVIGALLAGTMRPMNRSSMVASVIYCVAPHYAHLLELRQLERDARAEQLIDPLTQLPNRLLLGDRLDMVVKEARRTGECFAVLFIELGLPLERTTAGLQDALIIDAATRLQGIIRVSDTLARVAGGRFVMVLRHIVNKGDVERTTAKIIESFDAIHAGADSAQPLGNVGISYYPDDADDADDGAALLGYAEMAMHKAQQQKLRWQIHARSRVRAMGHELALRTRLREAMHNNELRLEYQPQIDAVSEDIVGMEALVRWDHPELGLIGPALFIPLAEESGLIVTLGKWVLRMACLQAQVWEQQFGLQLRLGVNLSAAQLVQSHLLEMVEEVLDETGIAPGLLELEITESLGIKQVPHLQENLRGLHRLGCHLAIDDFGTGAASLDYLRKLPAQRIKIDQSFVRNIGVDPDDEAIVRATVDMVHRLNRRVVAEGVETEDHLTFLRAVGCDELQGYLFARPLSADAFGRLLAERARIRAGGELVAEP